MDKVQQVSAEKIMSIEDTMREVQRIEEESFAEVEIQTETRNLIIDSQVFTTLMSCGRKTDLRFNRNFQALHGKSRSLQKGSAVHEHLEAFYKAVISGVIRKDAIGYGYAACETYMNSEEWTLEEEVEKKSVRDTLEEYHKYRANDSWIPLEVEVVKGKLLYEDDDIRILWKAKLDLTCDTPDGILPIDHKTMAQQRDTTSLNNQFIGQCLVSNTQKMVVNKIGFQVSLKPELRFPRHIVSYTQDRLAEWQNIILPYWCKIYLMYEESGYWPPNFTSCETKYGFCDYRAVCEGERNDRERILGQYFKVGEPWDINNLLKESND